MSWFNRIGEPGNRILKLYLLFDLWPKHLSFLGVIDWLFDQTTKHTGLSCLHVSSWLVPCFVCPHKHRRGSISSFVLHFFNSRISFMFWFRILMQWLVHIRLKLCSRYWIKIHLCLKPCHQREKISFVFAFEGIQRSVHQLWCYLSILSCACQAILMCQQAEKQYLQWTLRWHQILVL